MKEIVELLHSSSAQIGAAGDRVAAEEEASSEEYDYNIAEQDASVRDIINLESSGRLVFCFVKLDMKLVGRLETNTRPYMQSLHQLTWTRAT